MLKSVVWTRLAIMLPKNLLSLGRKQQPQNENSAAGVSGWQANAQAWEERTRLSFLQLFLNRPPRKLETDRRLSLQLGSILQEVAQYHHPQEPKTAPHWASAVGCSHGGVTF